VSSPSGGSGGVPENSVYADFLELELKAERDRKAALDTRGSSLVTSSGALFAVLAGVGSIGRATSAPVPGQGPPLLVVALIGFFAAALFGISAQWNRQYQVVNTEGLRQIVDDIWHEPTGTSMRRVSANYLRTIKTLRKGNYNKELLLRFGYSCQVGATLLLGPVVFLLIAVR
jgi:hypothetical protein